MQQFKALWLKELSGYFQSSFAYMILFIYMFVSIGGAFYFGSYLALHDPSVYALFYLQPIVLTALLPAVTMRLWSEEYKSGTAEFLLTQPLEPWQPVAAKFAAATVFGLIMPLLLLPFIFFTAQYLTLDWGNIVCAYLGLALFIALFCALGAFVSALNKHIIASYLLSVFVMALWIALPVTKLYESYTDFLLAEIGLSDAVYFVLFTAVLVFLNVLVSEYRYSAQKHKTWRFAGFSAILLVGTALVVLATDLIFTHKFDFSAHKFYTPQPLTRELIAKIDKPISIDVFIAKDFRAHNVEYFRYYQQVKRFLEKYRDLSGKMIRLNVTEVEPFSQLEDVVLGYGFYYEENASGTKDYFGAVVRDNDARGVTIKQFTAERGAYLEKDIDSALLKLIDEGDLRRNIGVYLDATQNLDNFNGLMLNLEEDYNIALISEDVYELSPELDLLILINPKMISTVFHYALDQYIMNGGKVIIFFDLLTKNQTDDTNLKMLSLVDFLDGWGILLGDKMAETGEIAPAYYTGNLPLNIYKALEFSVKNPSLQVKPIITNNGQYIGAVIDGILLSLYEESPHKDAEVRSSMLPHNSVSDGSVQVALIGDVDLIDDMFWVDERSSDKNPYSAVFKAANPEIVRNLIDDMLGVEAYRNLPVRAAYRNTLSIGQNIYDEIYGKQAPHYLQLEEEIEILKSAVYKNSGDDADKAAALMRVSEAGQKIVELQKQSDALLHQMKEDYTDVIASMMWRHIIFVPAGIVLLLFLVLRFINRRKCRRIKEMFDE